MQVKISLLDLHSYKNYSKNVNLTHISELKNHKPNKDFKVLIDDDSADEKGIPKAPEPPK